MDLEIEGRSEFFEIPQSINLYKGRGGSSRFFLVLQLMYREGVLVFPSQSLHIEGARTFSKIQRVGRSVLTVLDCGIRERGVWNFQSPTDHIFIEEELGIRERLKERRMEFS